MPFIEVNNVSKEFQIFKREKGFINSVKSLVNRKYETKTAVNNITFHIDRGELVGYIGPNGAGKSTTIKMLSGILLPTSGSIIVNGRDPYKNRIENAMHIGVVFGQRSQLYWDLPMEETFDIYKKMYKIENVRFKRNAEYYIELLEMRDFLRIPVRQLSLGQKMRANLAVALLHDPETVYLDEPTIGLDVVAKSRIRNFIREINKEKKTTIILTTHDMDDIEQICSRIIMINHGQILYDGRLESFKKDHSCGDILIVDLENENIDIHDTRLQLKKEEGPRKWFLFKRNEISVTEAIAILAHGNKIIDLYLKEPDIEDIVREIYEKNR